MPCNYPHRLQRGVEHDFMHIDVPCGRCMGCRINNAQAWAVRCANEAQLHQHNAFVTLTYDDANLANPPSLEHRDWQLFAKKLRNHRGPFRYYMCGEYGEKNKRPHFHACLFGIDFPDRKPITEKGEYTLYQSDELTALWAKGLCSIGSVTFTSAGYIARYITKQLHGEPAAQRYQQVNLQTGEIIRLTPEYIRMSRRPGIGADWLNLYQDEVLTHDGVHLNNRKYKTPRYYDQKLKELNPQAHKKIQDQRIKRAWETNPQEHTRQRRNAKEQVLTARIGLNQRKI